MLPEKVPRAKLEAQNPKSETSSKFKFSNLLNKFRGLIILLFGFVSDFDIRISILSFQAIYSRSGNGRPFWEKTLEGILRVFRAKEACGLLFQDLIKALAPPSGDLSRLCQEIRRRCLQLLVWRLGPPFLANLPAENGFGKVELTPVDTAQEAFC